MKGKLLTFLLATAVLMSLTIGISGCGKGNENQSGSKKVQTFTVEEGQIRVALEDGAAIDFGCLLEAGEELTIQKATPPSVDSDVEIYAYDFKLASGQPEGTIELIIPYDDSGLDSDEEILAVGGKYLNEGTGQWEDVLYTVDTEANEVHIFTDHLSTFGVFKVVDEGKRSEYISEVNAYASFLTTKQAEELLKTYAQQGSSWQEDVVASFLHANNSLPMFIETNIPTLLTLGGAYDEMISSQFGDALTVLGVVTSCTQFAYDAYTNGMKSTETAISGMKTLLNLGLNLYTTKEYLLNSFQVAYVGGSYRYGPFRCDHFAIDTKYESQEYV